MPLLEGSLWITSVINKILSNSINNNLCWLEGKERKRKERVVVCEKPFPIQTLYQFYSIKKVGSETDTTTTTTTTTTRAAAAATAGRGRGADKGVVVD
ncbi:MAG: hypothetical protein ACHQ1D_07490 [Nitrososphaerales archaeon]